jgi:hypothetical protein
MYRLRLSTLPVCIFLACEAISIHAQEIVEPANKNRAVTQRLTAFIEREVHAKKLPALSIALVDDQRIV